jgi:hypothetical protein
MGRLLLVVSIGLVVYWIYTSVSQSAFSLISGGEAMIVTTDDLEVHFQTEGPISDSFMVFGGHSGRVKNSFTDATLATLAIEEARNLHQSYPDFHRCSSPGAIAAQDAVETTHFVAADTGAREGLSGAVELHAMRVRSGGDRTCVAIRGQRLRLSAVKVKQDGTDVTDQIGPAYDDPIVYAEGVEVIDCQAALR